MKIYQDVFSNQDLISDAYTFEEDFEGVIIRVQSKMIVVGDVNVDVGCGNAFGGTNEEEDGEQGGDAGGAPPAKVNNVVSTFSYQQTAFDKAQFKQYFKEYMKKLKDYIQKNKPERIEAFTKGAKLYFQWVLDNFDNLTFHCPQSYDMENQLPISYWKNEDDEAPTFVYVMDGLKSYKV